MQEHAPCLLSGTCHCNNCLFVGCFRKLMPSILGHLDSEASLHSHLGLSLVIYHMSLQCCEGSYTAIGLCDWDCWSSRECALYLNESVDPVSDPLYNLYRSGLPSLLISWNIPRYLCQTNSEVVHTKAKRKIASPKRGELDSLTILIILPNVSLRTVHSCLWELSLGGGWICVNISTQVPIYCYSWEELGV